MSTHHTRLSGAAINNFDLIRLFAATQVAITHSAEHLHLHSPFLTALGYFPGVPIFFFISGYLIYQSYCNISTSRLRVFFTNRFLRLYPALFFCFFLTLISVYLSGYFSATAPNLTQLGEWAGATLTMLQFYNPPFLREYGVGAINGSLWTITVELQFYLLTPFLHFGFTKRRKTTFIILGFLMLANLGNSFFNSREHLAMKLFGVTFLPWFYMFAAGAYISASQTLQRHILKLHPAIYLTGYLIVYHLSESYGMGSGNSVNPLAYALMGCLVLKLANTKPKLSSLTLKGNDISYGVYIYHMPIVNLLVYLGFIGVVLGFITAILATFALALTSWFLVEKPALRLKKWALRAY